MFLRLHHHRGFRFEDPRLTAIIPTFKAAVVDQYQRLLVVAPSLEQNNLKV